MNNLTGCRYYSSIQANNRHGMRYKSFEGTWENLRPHTGHLVFTNGKVFDGVCKDGVLCGTLVDEDNKIEIRGLIGTDVEIRFEGRLVYAGIIGQNGKPLKGILYNPDGSNYDGTFDENENPLFGTITYNDGKVYVGEFTNGVRADGRLTFKHGAVYQGLFDPHGEPLEKTVTYQDVWVFTGIVDIQGNPIKGKKTMLRKRDYYVGEFFGGVIREGLHYNFRYDERYFGLFNEQGKYHGEGEIRYNDGTIYKGLWVSGNRSEGKVTYSNGAEFDGIWETDGGNTGVWISADKSEKFNGSIDKFGNFVNGLYESPEFKFDGSWNDKPPQNKGSLKTRGPHIGKMTF